MQLQNYYKKLAASAASLLATVQAAGVTVLNLPGGTQSACSSMNGIDKAHFAATHAGAVRGHPGEVRGDFACSRGKVG